MSSSAAEIEEILKAAFSPVHLSLIDKSCGCGEAFDCLLVSFSFEAQTQLQRHRAVNKALGDKLSAIHAFSLQCLTPQEWEKKNKETKQHTDAAS